MQRAMDQVSQSCDNYDLTISTKKTEVVHQPAPGKPYNEPTITVNGQKLKVVDKFTYLGIVEQISGANYLIINYEPLNKHSYVKNLGHVHL